MTRVYKKHPPTKAELNDEISHLRGRLREEQRRFRALAVGNLKEIVPVGDTVQMSYLFILEENAQLQKELEECRNLIDLYRKMYAPGDNSQNEVATMG